MKTDEMDLLIRVAETRSMTRAAAQLHLTPAAVSAAVQRIEAALGVRIFERTTRALHPTAEGEVVLAGCRDVLARWQRTLDDARDHRTELAGTVRLSAPADTSYLLLEPLLARLGDEHPGLRIVLAVSDSIQHLHREAIDLAIRYGPLDDSRLTARRLAVAPPVLVASPGYLETHGTPRDVDALTAHRCITLHTGNRPQMSWRVRVDGADRRVAVDSPLCGDGFLARRWALAGMGIAQKSLLDVIDDLEEGRLVQVLPAHAAADLPIHAVFPSRRFQPARVRAVADALAEVFAERGQRCAAWTHAQSAGQSSSTSSKRPKS